MKKTQQRFAQVLLLGAVLAVPAMWAGTVSVSQGNAASGLVSDTVYDPLTLTPLLTGPPPFDQAYGDTLFTNFAATWTFTGYGTPAPSAATLTIGIWNNDSGNFGGSTTHGNEVADFTVGGVDLTSQLNTVFDSHGGQLNEYSVYTLTLPSSTFTGIETGSLPIVLDLQGPGWADSLVCDINGCTSGGPVDTTTVGAALVFSTLDITTGGGVTGVPEPASFLLTGSVLLLVAATLRRRRSRARSAMI